MVTSRGRETIRTHTARTLESRCIKSSAAITGSPHAHAASSPKLYPGFYFSTARPSSSRFLTSPRSLTVPFSLVTYLSP